MREAVITKSAEHADQLQELSESEIEQVQGGDLYTYVWVYWVGYESAYSAGIQPRSAAM